jgi:D-arabinose 1-dehydrogenase-like Zn-dependent alcohol dehydrogenase
LERGNPALVVRLEREAPREVGGRERHRWPRLTIESRPLVSRPAPGDLRVRMLLAGVCGTDLHLIRPDPETGYIVGSVPFAVGPAG